MPHFLQLKIRHVIGLLLLRTAKMGMDRTTTFFFFKLSHLHVVLKQWPKILYEWLFLLNLFLHG